MISPEKIEKTKNLTIEVQNDAMWVNAYSHTDPPKADKRFIVPSLAGYSQKYGRVGNKRTIIK